MLRQRAKNQTWKDERHFAAKSDLGSKSGYASSCFTLNSFLNHFYEAPLTLVELCCHMQNVWALSLPSCLALRQMVQCVHTNRMETMKSCKKGSCKWNFITGNVKMLEIRYRLFYSPVFRAILNLCLEASGDSQMNCLNISNLWNFHHHHHHHCHRLRTRVCSPVLAARWYSLNPLYTL